MILIPMKFGDELTKYLELLEEYLQEYSKDKKSSDGLDMDEFNLITFDYPNILRKSFIMICCSILEQELFAECKFRKKSEQLSKGLSVDENDLKTVRNIGKAMEYIEQYVDISPSTAKSWNDIKDIQKIRNCIVHSENVSDCTYLEQIQRYVKTRKEEDISIKGDTIMLTKEYCKYVVDTFSKFEFDIKSWN